ncbi:hypothetical protein ATANTOWER_007173 [Ataeniobius toweri]|uniref:Uncharacterized protein n=1 Tax=Ataeniobius toweri TaxID=208326 RepID=A0ABU7B593_9TELE|nr:hypothetical protein [Ataeniobius toweri]
MYNTTNLGGVSTRLVQSHRFVFNKLEACRRATSTPAGVRAQLWKEGKRTGLFEPIDVACCAQNNEFLVSSEVLCCWEFSEKPLSSLHQMLADVEERKLQKGIQNLFMLPQ